ncbi:MAG TPA: hypothetical protein VFW87_10935, partial [Pirellulales bacterium]|nr:hypothetical protein [Pirellulales bacterium]
YLYGWPVENLLIFWFGLSPLSLFPAAAVITAALGYCSWRLVERPCLRLKPVRVSRAIPT